MAIKKRKVWPNGVTTTYHHIPMIKVEVNQDVTILVHSYINENSRLIDKDATIDYIPQHYEYNYYSTGSDNFMTIEKAYEWLKSQPEFEGAEDC